MRARIILVALLMCSFLLAGAEAADLEVRVFTLKHKTPAEASQEIQPLLSKIGSLTVKPGDRSLTVQDRKEVVDRVAAFLETYDVAPPEFGIRLSLMLATNKKPKDGSAAEIAEGLLWRLRRMFRYQFFIPQGSSVVHGKVGSEVIVKLTDTYRVAFNPQSFLRVSNPSSVRLSTSLQPAQKPSGTARPTALPARRRFAHMPMLRLEHFTLTKEELGKDGAVHRQDVLRTSVILSSGQRAVLGAASSEAAESALVLVIEALPEGEK